MTKRSPQFEAAILAGFTEGLSLSVACSRCGVSRAAFLQWKATDPDLAQRYETAQLSHAESLVDSCLDLADDLDRLEGGGAVARFTRLQIETRLKVARLYFKRHEAAAERRAREEELHRARHAAEPDEMPPGTADEKRPAPAAVPVTAVTEPRRLATAAEAREPERRYASG